MIIGETPERRDERQSIESWCDFISRKYGKSGEYIDQFTSLHWPKKKEKKNERDKV